MCSHTGTVLDASTLFTSQALEYVDVGKNRTDAMITNYLGNPILCLWVVVRGCIYSQDMYRCILSVRLRNYFTCLNTWIGCTRALFSLIIVSWIRKLACPHCYCTSQLFWKMVYSIPGILFVSVLLTALFSVFVFHILWGALQTVFYD